LVSFLVRGADHMLSEKSQWTENGTMFVDIDWLLNASSPLSASAELLVFSVTVKILQNSTSDWDCTVQQTIGRKTGTVKIKTPKHTIWWW